MIKNVSIIVTARNYGNYLKECLKSCINQSVKPYEVIYSDDCSEDDSVKIARSIKGVKVLAHKQWLKVVEARNRGVDASKGNILVHVDGDDVLPYDYLEKHFEVFDQSTPFVYGAAQAFGTRNNYWKVEPWAQRFIWNRNFVNTSAMIWKDAFMKVGGWQETCCNTMWDWSLALRLSRLGTPRKSPATLLYRQHTDSWSLKKEKSENKLLEFSNLIRKDLVNITVGLIYSGRIARFYHKWIDQLIKDISILKNKPELIIINNSDEDLELEYYASYFSVIKVINDRKKLYWDNEVDRRNKVSTLLADQYNMILENATGELIHLREDDIIPFDDSFKKIFHFITNGNPVNAAVAGLYFNRSPRWRKFVGGYYNEENPKATIDIDKLPDNKPFIIDFTGTGFLFFWKDLCPIFEPFIDGIQAHDWAWGMKLKKSGKQLWIIPDAICKHYTDDKDFVIPPKESLELAPIATYTTISKGGEIERVAVKYPEVETKVNKKVVILK